MSKIFENFDTNFMDLVHILCSVQLFLKLEIKKEIKKNKKENEDTKCGVFHVNFFPQKRHLFGFQ